MKIIISALAVALALGFALPAASFAASTDTGASAIVDNDSFDRRGRGGSGRDKPRIPGGSGCDDPRDIIEHPECRG